MKTNVIIFCLIFVLSFIFIGYNIIDKAIDSNLRFESLEKEYEKINKKNDSLTIHINLEKKNIDFYKNKIDSLQSIKEKIKYVYYSKYKKIDNSTINVIVNEFDSIFSVNSIK